MKKSKKLLFGLGGLTAFIPATTLLSAGCKDTKTAESIKTSGYTDSIVKLNSGDITMMGAWGDARQFAKEDWDKLVAVGASDIISNDGVQAREDLKEDDIKAVQNLFLEAIRQANADKKAEKETDLTYKDDKEEIQSMFKIYNHDDYGKLGYDSTIVTSSGETKKAYNAKPEAGGDYFEVAADGKVTWKGKDKFKIQFIPSSDPALVTKVTKGLQKWMNKQLGKEDGEAIEISVSSSYEAAATVLASKNQDIAFLPVGTWSEKCPEAKFILTSGRSVQIIDPYKSVDAPSIPAITDEKILVDAMNHYRTFNKSDKEAINWIYIDKDAAKNPKEATEGYPEELKKVIDGLATGADLPIVGYYRSYIYVKKGSEIEKLITKELKEKGSDWKLKWDDVKEHVTFGFTGTTSSASYVYPEKWFTKHFEGFESFVKSTK